MACIDYMDQKITPSFVLKGLWLNCISSVEITLFLLADILLQHRALFQC